jgi:hypothetical protein
MEPKPCTPPHREHFSKTPKTRSKASQFSGSHNCKTKQNKLPSFIDRWCLCEKTHYYKIWILLHIFCVSKFCQSVTKIKKGAKIVQRIFLGKNLTKVIIFLGGKKELNSQYIDHRFLHVTNFKKILFFP